MVSVPTTLQDLERRLTELAGGQDELNDGTDIEREVFRTIDLLDQDRNARRELERIGTRYAEGFIAPYLHAADLRGVLHEVDGLLAIHRRGRLRVDGEGPEGVRVGFQRLADDVDANAGPATAFDSAVVLSAVRTRFPNAHMEPDPEGSGDTSYTFWRIRAR